MEYNLRNPKATDLFIVTKMINKIGVKNIIKVVRDNDEVNELRAQLLEENKYTDENGSVAHKEFTKEQVNQMGELVVGLVIDLVLDRIELVQDDLFKFMSALSGLTVTEVADLGWSNFYKMIVDILKLDGVTDFIQDVLKSFK